MALPNINNYHIAVVINLVYYEEINKLIEFFVSFRNRFAQISKLSGHYRLGVKDGLQ